MDQVTATSPRIAMDEVESSQLDAIGHNPESNVLAIQFKGKEGAVGSLYRYRNVSAELFTKLKEADSIGSFFYKNIKPHADLYPYTKVLDEFGTHYSTKIKENGDPYLLNWDGTRSTFCDIDE